MHSDHKKLRLEFLESRVMLAATDVPETNLSDEVALAVNSDVADVEVNLTALDRMLIVQGPGHGNLSIDLSGLPSSIVNIWISSFDSVTFSGNATVEHLSVRDVDRLDAGQISIKVGLFAEGVDHIRIDTAPIFIWLENSDGARGFEGVVGGKTLIETNRFVNGAHLYSFLDNLGLAATEGAGELNIFNGNQDQLVLMNFQPGDLNVSGVDSISRHVNVIKGDFARYFLATPAERASLEQSLAIARQAASGNLVSFSTFLSNFFVQTALGGLFDNGAAIALNRAQPLAGFESAAGPSEARLGETMSLALDADDETPVSHRLDPLDFNVLLDGTAPSAALLHRDESAAFVAAPELPAEISGTSTRPLESVVSGTAALALARLGEPFVQLVFDLGTRFSTFGDIASAHFSDHLKSDSRPALLVDARAAKRQEVGFSVVSV